MKNPLKKNTKADGTRRTYNSSQMRKNSDISPRRRQRNTDSGTPNKRSQTKRKKNLIKFSLIGVAIVALGAISWNNSRINEIRIADGQDKYLSTVEQYLERNPFANLKPLVSTGVIAENLSSIYPEVADVTVNVPFLGNTIEVQVITRTDQLVLKTGENDYFVVDQEGYAYARYDTDKGLEGVLILDDDTDVDYGSEASGQFVAPTLVSFIQSANEKLSQIESYKDQTFSFRITDEPRLVYIKSSKVRYELKFQQDLTVEQQIDNLNSALQHLSSRKITPQQYIDVRINGTVYYK